MRFLFLGDIVGRTGRQMIMHHLPRLRREMGLDMVLANAENASGGVGLSAKNARELHKLGIDAITTGNHVWKFTDLGGVLDSEPWIVRPANFPGPAPGRGWSLVPVADHLPPVAVINLQGRTYMPAIDCPFAAVERILAEVPADAVTIVDMHAEATSEKRALAHVLRGRVQAVVGTHTHVLTNDATILDGVTGYLTDLGMCGPEDSCLGMDNDIIVRKFQTGLPQKFRLSEAPAMLNGAVIEINNGRCVEIASWKYRGDEGDSHD